jgi:subtilisin family serine protease
MNLPIPSKKVFFIGGLALLGFGRLLAPLAVGDTAGQPYGGPAGAAALAAINGWRLLTPGQVAVIEHGEPTGSGAGLAVSVGKQELVFEDDTMRTFVVADPKVRTFVSDVPQVTIHEALVDDEAEGAAAEVAERFAISSDPVPVIVELNLAAKPLAASDSKQRSLARQELKTAQARVRQLAAAPGQLGKNLDLIGAVAGEIDQATFEALRHDPTVKRISLDGVAQIQLDASLEDINAPSVWSLADPSGNPLTGAGEVVAVIDTGVDYTHPDLGGCFGPTCKVVGGYDFYNGDPDPMDDNGHGTHVAGVIAGSGVLTGVAPEAKLLAYKVCSSAGSNCAHSSIVQALGYAVDPNQDGDPSDQVSVVNISLGGSGNPDDAASLAVDAATAAGVTVVVAAGNTGPNVASINSPGKARTAITVGASCQPGQINVQGYCLGSKVIASFSSLGPLIWLGQDLGKPDLVAPGVAICSARWGTSFATSPTCAGDSKHVRISGTSMATPHVAGAAALVRQANPSYSPAEVKTLLKITATDLGVSADQQGVGKINLAAAVPQSSSVVATPGTWTATSSPLSRWSETSATFQITTSDETLETLEPESGFSVDGISLSFDKDTLSVSGGDSATFTATVTVDNDLVPAGFYVGSINLSVAGERQGLIPVFLTVTPTVASATALVDFGLDNPSLAEWEATADLVLRNLRTDVEQTLTLDFSSLGEGVTLSGPANVTLAAGATATSTLRVAVDNTTLVNGQYSGIISATNEVNTVSINTQFKKYYVIIVQNAGPSELEGALLWLHNRQDESYFLTQQTSPASIYLDTAGPYDLMVSYYGGTRHLFEEGIDLSEGQVVFNQRSSHAQNSLVLEPVGVDGARLNPSQVLNQQHFLYNPVPAIQMLGMGGSISFPKAFSAVSTNYTYTGLYDFPYYQPARDLYYYTMSFTGLSDDLTYRNEASDVRAFRLKTDTNLAEPAWTSVKHCKRLYGLCYTTGYPFNSGPKLDMPAEQTLYLLDPPADDYFQAKTNDTGIGCPASGICPTIFFSPNFFPATGERRYVSNFELPPLTEDAVYNGLGPAVWSGRFTNSALSVGLTSYPDAGSNKILFVRQDFSSGTYPAPVYAVEQGGAVVESGTLPERNRYAVVGTQPAIPTVTLPVSGPATFRATSTHQIGGENFSARVLAEFDTSLTDRNPPTIKRLYFFTDDERSETFGQAPSENRLELEFDPMGGEIAEVTAGLVAQDGSVEALTVNADRGVYEAVASATIEATSTTLRVSGIDDSGNSLTYDFDLPVVTSNLPVILSEPSLSLGDPSELASSSVTLNANLTALGDAAVTERGFTWGVTESYGATTTDTVAGPYELGAFSVALEDLTCGTSYHYRAYAASEAGIGYTNDAQFLTADCPLEVTIPTLALGVPEDLAQNRVTLNGEITALGNDLPVTRGFEWGESDRYGATTTDAAPGPYGLGSFAVGLTGLDCGTAYYYRAFAINAAGIGRSAGDLWETAACDVGDIAAPTPGEIIFSAVSINSLVASSTGASDESALAAAPFRYYNVTRDAYSELTAGTILWEDLSPATTYQFQVGVVDAAGNWATSTTFATSTLTEVDEEEPSNSDRRDRQEERGGGGGGGGGGRDKPKVVPVAAPPNPLVLGGSISFTRTLEMGAVGQDVRELQRLLNRDLTTRVAVAGPGAPGQETDYFGPATQAALGRLQLKYGLVASPTDPAFGHLGPRTRELCNSLCKATVSNPDTRAVLLARLQTLLEQYFQLLQNQSRR